METWKDIIGYEDYYQISNLGRVKSKSRKSWNGHKWHLHKEKILKPLSIKDGYQKVSLCKNGKYEQFFIHRLVAMAFIPNPDNLPIINHKDENPSNNNMDNLEWCTYRYNNNYGHHNENLAKAFGKIVLQFDLDGNFIKEYPSAKVASDKMNCSLTNICDACRGRILTACNFQWRYKGYTNKVLPIASSNARSAIKQSKPVVQYDLQGNAINEFSSCMDAYRHTGFAYGNISAACRGRCKTAYGYIWKYKSNN